MPISGFRAAVTVPFGWSNQKLARAEKKETLPTLDGLPMDVESAAFETKAETATKLLKQIEDLHTYVERNQPFIPN